MQPDYLNRQHHQYGQYPPHGRPYYQQPHSWPSHNGWPAYHGGTIPMERPQRRGRNRWLGVMAVLLTLVGLGVVVFAMMSARPGPPQATSDGGPIGTPQDVAPPMARSLPVRIAIPSIGVDAPVAAKGLDSAGRLEPPSLTDPQQTGWYRNGPTPGQQGPAVIEGHVDSYQGPAVFYRLGAIHKGATVKVGRADGSTATFTVDSIQRASKDAFPTAKVYGGLSYPGLRIITCGGSFDSAKRSYTDNTIVYAHLTSS